MRFLLTLFALLIALPAALFAQDGTPPVTGSAAIDALLISTSVVALVQLSKWGGLPDRYGPLAVIFYSLLTVALFGYSKGIPFVGLNVWEYFSAVISVMLQAAGIFGFTRASGEAVSRMTPPPGGSAGGSPTV